MISYEIRIGYSHFLISLKKIKEINEIWNIIKYTRLLERKKY